MHDFNKQVIRARFNQAAKTYELTAELSHEMAQRLLEHLDWMRLNPERIVDLGAGTGYVTQLLEERYPQAQIFSVDFAQAMLQQHRTLSNKESARICADAEHIPFADESIDLVVSDLMLPWCQDIRKIFAEIWRVLKGNGILLFSTLGPDTLGELRASWATADDEPHVHAFFDLHDVGDMLLQQKFLEPVMQAEWITWMYTSAKALFADLKNLGAVNVLTGRRLTLTGKKRFQQFLAEYQTYQNEVGKLPATFEVIYGHCWKPMQTVNEVGEIIISTAIPVKNRR